MRSLKKSAFRGQDIFSDSHALRSAEKSQIFRALCSSLAVTGKNIFALRADFFPFSKISVLCPLN